MNVLLLSTIAPAHAWNPSLDGSGNEIYWPSGTTTIRLNYAGSVSATDRGIIDLMAGEYNRGPHDVDVVTQVDGDATQTFANGESEVWWADITSPAAVYTVADADGDIVETDLVYDSAGMTWDRTNVYTNTDGYGGPGRSFRSLTLHELGHVLGLGHEADVATIMGSDMTFVALMNGVTIDPAIGGDALEGLVTLHGAGPDIVDVGVLHWRRTGSTGGYAVHDITRIRNLAWGAVTNTRNAANVPVYKVPAGHEVYAEFLWDNQGSDCEPFDIDLYLSQDELLAFADTLLGSFVYEVCPGPSVLANLRAAIPSTVSGLRYLGPRIVDDDGNNSNRTAWLAVDVVPNGHADLCSYGVPCKRGYGDCDDHAASTDCESGLTCRVNNGAAYGFGATTDVCE